VHLTWRCPAQSRQVERVAFRLPIEGKHPLPVNVPCRAECLECHISEGEERGVARHCLDRFNPHSHLCDLWLLPNIRLAEQGHGKPDRFRPGWQDMVGDGDTDAIPVRGNNEQVDLGVLRNRPLLPPELLGDIHRAFTSVPGDMRKAQPPNLVCGKLLPVKVELVEA